jgi:hypothetical protein
MGSLSVMNEMIHRIERGKPKELLFYSIYCCTGKVMNYGV